VDIDLTDGKNRAEDALQPRATCPRTRRSSRMWRGARRDAARADIIAAAALMAVGDRVAAADLSQAAGLRSGSCGPSLGSRVVAVVAVGLSVGGARPAAAATVVATTASLRSRAPEPDPTPAKDATRFGRGTWLDHVRRRPAGGGPADRAVPRLRVAAVAEPAGAGAGVVVEAWPLGGPQGDADERAGHRRGVVHIGGGIKTVRVVATETPWTLRATGTTRRVVVTTEPCDGV
jgi:hypothetical protein